MFLNHPECSRQCVNGMIESLSGHYNIKIISKEFFNSTNLREVDIVAFPGGIGDADSYYEFFKRRHGNAVADFIDRGGYYLGICMGAYWAGSNYFDILNGVEPVQYINREDADIRRPYGTVAHVNWLGKSESMFFYDGCALIGERDGPEFDTIARYANGDPMAIIQRRIGLIGCHPEAEEFWYKDKYKYINKFWNHKRHHGLLLDFVDRLTGNMRDRDGQSTRVTAGIQGS